MVSETETEEDVEVRKQENYENQTKELDRAIRLVWGFSTVGQESDSVLGI